MLSRLRTDGLRRGQYVRPRVLLPRESATQAGKLGM